jgi:copper chaperone CopZ
LKPRIVKSVLGLFSQTFYSLIVVIVLAQSATMGETLAPAPITSAEPAAVRQQAQAQQANSKHSTATKLEQGKAALEQAGTARSGGEVKAEQAGTARSGGEVKAEQAGTARPGGEVKAEQAGTARSGGDVKAEQAGTARSGGDVKAEQAGTARSAPTAEPAWHRMQMRLSGSMCPACLKELTDNIKKLPGVILLKFERPQAVFTTAVSPDVSNWAEGCVIYDANKLAIDYLRDAIRQNGYHSYRVLDKELGHEPQEKDIRFAK